VRENSQRNPKETQRESEERAEIEEPAFAEATVGKCETSGVVFFHFRSGRSFVEQCFRETETPQLLPSLGAVWMLCFRRLKMQENAVYRYVARFGQAVFAAPRQAPNPK
jgi:hypothetical protein